MPRRRSCAAALRRQTHFRCENGVGARHGAGPRLETNETVEIGSTRQPQGAGSAERVMGLRVLLPARHRRTFGSPGRPRAGIRRTHCQPACEAFEPPAHSCPYVVILPAGVVNRRGGVAGLASTAIACRPSHFFLSASAELLEAGDDIRKSGDLAAARKRRRGLFWCASPERARTQRVRKGDCPPAGQAAPSER
jgi:hypothetical protein